MFFVLLCGDMISIANSYC